MRHVSSLRSPIVCAALAALGLGSLLANQTQAATQQYFDVNGTTAGYGITNGSTYSWEGAFWTTTSGGAASTSNYVNDGTGFPRFYGGSSGNNYTVTVGTTERTVGMYLNASGVTLNINQAPSTSGGLTVESGMQGFLVNGTALIINAPISGNGGVQQSQSGALSLYGNNSYTGGTQTTGGQTLNYNNNNSFGTGPITFTASAITSVQGFVNTGPAGAVVANNLGFAAYNPPTNTNTDNAINFVSGGSVANPGTNFTGTLTLPASGTISLQGNSVGSVTKFSGVISGGAALSITNNTGTLIFAGANTYTGSTTLAAGILRLGAANTIATTSSLILGGGTLNPGGFSQAMSGTLGMTASSTIDFGAGAAELDFANSSALAWTGTLNLLNWDPSVDKIRFDSSPAGLTAAQLAKIQFNGAGLGTGHLDANGYLVVPEPASLSLLGLGATALLARRRRA